MAVIGAFFALTKEDLNKPPTENDCGGDDDPKANQIPLVSWSYNNRTIGENTAGEHCMVRYVVAPL
jgi:hypothetical protein